MANKSANTRVRIKGTGIYLRQEPMYDGASRGRRVRNWMPGISSPNSVIWSGLQTLRSRSRDLSRKNPLIDSAYDKISANVIGTGIRAFSLALDTRTRDDVDKAWRIWTEECDAEDLQDLSGCLSVSVRGAFESGEVFIRFRERRIDDGYYIPLQIQILEAEFVDHTHNNVLPNGNFIIAGIEHNILGKRVAYHMYREHPGERSLRGSSQEKIRVPASEVIHFFRPSRPGQVRGIPAISSAILKARDWQVYDEAELVRKQTAAMLVGFITRTPPESSVMPSDGPGSDDDEGVEMAALEPGTMQLLDYGEDVTFSDPKDSGTNYESYVRGIWHQISGPLILTYAQFSGDISDVNYSSIRAGQNEFQKRARKEQDAIVHMILKRCRKRVIEAGVMAGKIHAPGFVSDPTIALETEWTPPGWKYVNPQQEARADQYDLQSGVTSRRRKAAQHGDDIRAIDRERREDLAREEEYGLTSDFNGAIEEVAVVNGEE